MLYLLGGESRQLDLAERRKDVQAEVFSIAYERLRLYAGPNRLQPPRHVLRERLAFVSATRQTHVTVPERRCQLLACLRPCLGVQGLPTAIWQRKTRHPAIRLAVFALLKRDAALAIAPSLARHLSPASIRSVAVRPRTRSYCLLQQYCLLAILSSRMAPLVTWRGRWRWDGRPHCLSSPL